MSFTNSNDMRKYEFTPVNDSAYAKKIELAKYTQSHSKVRCAGRRYDTFLVTFRVRGLYGHCKGQKSEYGTSLIRNNSYS